MRSNDSRVKQFPSSIYPSSPFCRNYVDSKIYLDKVKSLPFDILQIFLNLSSSSSPFDEI